MRIALVTDFYLPSLGGAQTSIVNQRRALQADGHTVLLFAPNYLESEPTDDTTVIRIPSFRTKLLPFPLVAPNKKTQALLKTAFVKNKTQVVHVQTEFGLSQAAVKAAQDLNLPVFYTIHTFAWQTNIPLATAQAALVRGVYRAATGQRLPMLQSSTNENPATTALKSITFAMVEACKATICPSQHIANQLRLAGTKKPLYVVPNPLAPNKPRPIKPLPSIPHFVWPSRCLPEKRLIEFVQAVLLARRKTSKPFFVDIIGDGFLLPAAQKLAGNDPQTIFHGRLSQEEVIQHIDNGSLVAVSSYNFDNQPMIIAEAISRHRGVLYCDPNLREGTEHAGYLTGPEPKAIAKGIIDLVEHPQKIKKLSDGATKDKTIFSAQTFSSCITRIYTS